MQAGRGLVLFIWVFHFVVTAATGGFMGFIQGDLYILAVMGPLLAFRIGIWICLFLYEKKRHVKTDVDEEIAREEERRRAVAIASAQPPYAPSHPTLVPENDREV